MTQDTLNKEYHTSFAEFYSSMINTPYIGGYYATLAPLLILIVGLIFGFLGVFKYNSKMVESMTLYNLNKENSKDTRVQRQFQSSKSLLETVLAGESAILKEYESLKNK